LITDLTTVNDKNVRVKKCTNLN